MSSIINNGLNKDSMDTKEEIKQIAYDFTTSKGDCKKLENRILSLFGVSQQRELLIGYNKYLEDYCDTHYIDTDTVENYLKTN